MIELELKKAARASARASGTASKQPSSGNAVERVPSTAGPNRASTAWTAPPVCEVEEEAAAPKMQVKQTSPWNASSATRAARGSTTSVAKPQTRPPPASANPANARRLWARAGAASRVGGKLTVAQLKTAGKRVETELEVAQKELERRKSQLASATETAQTVLGAESGWVQVIDPESGAPYYFNAGTGETSWEEPLPEGWSVAQDDSGATYFWNASTGEASWERPGNQAPSAEKPAELEVTPMPLWKQLGVPQASKDAEAAELLDDLRGDIDAAVEAGDFEKAIKLRDDFRVSLPRRESVHRISAVI